MMKIAGQLQCALNKVFTELIKEKGLEDKMQACPSQEEHHADITLKNNNGEPIFFIKLEDPTVRDGKTIFDSGVLVREAERAQRINIRHFGICNFLACAFIDKDNLHEKVSVKEGFFSIRDTARLSNDYSPDKEMLSKLIGMASFYLDHAIEIIERKPITYTEIDKLFIFKIRKLIEAHAFPISSAIWEKYKADKTFESDIHEYAQSQSWSKPTTFIEIENLAHISLLMLTAKLILYKNFVKKKEWHVLHPMTVAPDVDTPQKVEKIISRYFETFHEASENFELLIGERSDIIYKMPFASEAVIDLVRAVLDIGGHYDFSNIPFDIIGRIYEELIHGDERHKLGQHFTSPDVIDLINAFTIHKSQDKVFDPSCGSGTFLVRAYERKKTLGDTEGRPTTHKNLLDEIYGNDLSGYPAYLSMLNLSIRDTNKPSYPRIVNKDFFSISESTTVAFHNHSGQPEQKILPKFDAIIGNPPYTRQEDIGTMHGTVKKESIQNLITKECGFTPSQRTSIYAYFFYHASIFLKNEGYLGFIVQNSWLDTDYGVDLQRYISRTYEIIAIIDSKVERFFPSAAVNTSIVILRKQADELKRNQHLVKFIYLKTTLPELIKIHGDITQLNVFIQSAKESVDNEFLKINCIKQELLSNCKKWGLFLKAPQVYFDVIKKGNENLKLLCGKEGISAIRYGLKSGCNEYFFGKDVTYHKNGILISTCINNNDNFKSKQELKAKGLRIFQNGLNECWLIEKQFLSSAIKLTRDITDYIIDDVKSGEVIFYVNRLKEFDSIAAYRNNMQSIYPYAYAYIAYGEKKLIKDAIISKKRTCASRPAWWDLGAQKRKDFILIQFRDKRNWNPFVNTELLLGNVAFFGEFHNPKRKKTYFISLNSIFSILQAEMLGRVNLGQGLLTTYGSDLEMMHVLDIEPGTELQKEIDCVYNLFTGIPATSIFEELGTDNHTNFSLSKVAPHRFELDNLFLKLLGYNSKKERENMLTSLYTETIQIIKSRIEKTQSSKGINTKRNKLALREKLFN